MIELRGVTKRFGQNFAIKNLSFASEGNEFVVIVGPAGAGKSTTLRLVAGIMKPNYGEIYFNANMVNDIPPERRNVSMAFENYVLYSHLTNYNNLAFPLRAKKVPEPQIRERVLRMAHVLGIENELDRKPGFLSGGQRQRVALGRCLIREADVFLLDEPISHLDARLKIHMRSELKNICAEKNATVVHVTHDYREAMSLADRMIVLNQGVLMQMGSPQDVYHRPDNEFVAHFVGDPPMSFIDASLQQQDGQLKFVLENTECSIPVAQDFNSALATNAATIRLGLRANCTTLAQSKNADHTVPGKVYLIESQGHRRLVSVKLEKAIVRIIVPYDQDWEIGQQTWLRVQADYLHVFADGKAIYHPDECNVIQRRA
ncbi:MAG: ABC transporter ATP-binding protein [Clostridiaceae bacterium]